MMKKKKRGVAWVLSAALGFVCALVLGALFYGTMVYQLAGKDGQAAHQPQATAAPLDLTKAAASLFPGPLLSVPGELQEETVRDEMRAGTSCRVVLRTYLAQGVQATAVSAWPADYLSALAEEGFSPMLITGFTLAGLDAVCESRDGMNVLAAREGDRVYLLAADADEQTLYALGAAAALEYAEE